MGRAIPEGVLAMGAEMSETTLSGPPGPRVTFQGGLWHSVHVEFRSLEILIDDVIGKPWS